jgi:hypothetical protein
MKIYIGHDHREEHAYSVAERSARAFGCQVEPLREDRLRASGVLTRPKDTRGQQWDIVSGAPQSTDFAIARFAVPILCHSGWALFADCDVVFMRDPRAVMDLADPSKAVYCVKHGRVDNMPTVKMDGQAQTQYSRKLWSSVMLFNCDHEANRRLNLTTLNAWPGRDLHAFKWLHDDEIGDLPMAFNWLVGLQPKPADAVIAHYTLGVPGMPDRDATPYDYIWNEAAEVSER